MSDKTVEKLGLGSFTKGGTPIHNKSSANIVGSAGSAQGISDITPDLVRSTQRHIQSVYKSLGHGYNIVGGSTLPSIQLKDSSSDAVYVEAELLLELIAKQTLSITMLSPQQKISILLYLYKYNKKIGRIIDLFVNIPLSGMELKYPDKIDNPIIRDYIRDFYEDMWSDLRFQEVITKAYRDKRLFGFGAVLLSDDYSYSTFIYDDNTETMRQETILDFNNIKESMKALAKDVVQSGDDLEEVQKLIKKYVKDKNSITLDSKKAVIFRYFPNMQGDEQIKLKDSETWFERYTGLKFIKNIDPYEVINREYNSDINYYKFKLKTDTRIKASFSNVRDEQLKEVATMLQNLGYSKSYLRTFTATQKTIDLDTYPFSSTDCWVATISNGTAYSDKDKSILNRVLSQAIDLEVVAKSNRNKANRAYKSITIYNVEATGDDFHTVDNLIYQANQKEGATYITTNKSITPQEVAMDARQTVDLDAIAMKAEEDLISGLGMTDSLVGGSDSYANSYLKLELLTNEFIQERQDIARFIEEQVFKPIAIKKGLFYRNTWGKVVPVYPKVSFGRISLARNSEDFQLLLNMAENGKLPYTYILKALNFDVDEMKNLIENEQSTIFNSKVKDYLTDKILESEHFAKFVVKDKNHISKILKELNIEVSEKELDEFIITLEERVLTEEDVDTIVQKYKEEQGDGTGALSYNSEASEKTNKKQVVSKILNGDEILTKIGGADRLKSMVGADNFKKESNLLSFKFKSSKEANLVIIKNEIPNQFTVAIILDSNSENKTVYKQSVKELEEFRKIFNKVTGLSLPINF